MPLSDHQTRHKVNKNTPSPPPLKPSFARSSHNVFACCQNIRVSLNYSQIRARDSSAYPAVSTQSHLLMRRSLRLGVYSEVDVTTVHDRALLTGLFFGKEFSPAMAPTASLHTLSCLHALCDDTESQSDSSVILAYETFQMRTSGLSLCIRSCAGPCCVLQAPSFVLKHPCPLLWSQEQGKKLFLSRSKA